MKNLLPILMLFFACNNKMSEASTATTIKNYNGKSTIYQFKTTDLSGEEFDFANLKGKKIMIVNTASKCGFTPQYEILQSMYEKYQDIGFAVVGFPANNFLFQEPGDDEKIAGFCEKNYGVTFPMMSKSSVKGKDMNPIYKYLTDGDQNGFGDSAVKWNFQKYLINEEGYLVNIIPSKEKPDSEEVIKWIESNIENGK